MCDHGALQAASTVSSIIAGGSAEVATLGPSVTIILQPATLVGKLPSTKKRRKKKKNKPPPRAVVDTGAAAEPLRKQELRFFAVDATHAMVQSLHCTAATIAPC